MSKPVVVVGCTGVDKLLGVFGGPMPGVENTVVVLVTVLIVVTVEHEKLPYEHPLSVVLDVKPERNMLVWNEDCCALLTYSDLVLMMAKLWWKIAPMMAHSMECCLVHDTKTTNQAQASYMHSRLDQKVECQW